MRDRRTKQAEREARRIEREVRRTKRGLLRRSKRDEEEIRARIAYEAGGMCWRCKGTGTRREGHGYGSYVVKCEECGQTGSPRSMSKLTMELNAILARREEILAPPAPTPEELEAAKAAEADQAMRDLEDLERDLRSGSAPG